MTQNHLLSDELKRSLGGAIASAYNTFDSDIKFSSKYIKYLLFSIRFVNFDVISRTSLEPDRNLGPTM